MRNDTIIEDYLSGLEEYNFSRLAPAGRRRNYIPLGHSDNPQLLRRFFIIIFHEKYHYQTHFLIVNVINAHDIWHAP